MAITNRPFEGYLGKTPDKPTYDYMVIGDKVHTIHRVIVHKFIMADVDDPDIYAAQPLWEWQQSEVGQWVMSHAIEPPVWNRYVEPMSYATQYAITAKLKGIDYTFWQLKYAQTI